MSVQAMMWARGTAPTGGSQLVLFALADRADEHGITWVGQKTLAEDCSCSERSVRDNLKALERRRVIARVHRYRHGARTSDYTVLGPLSEDRGQMLDVEELDIQHERWPREVGELATDCVDDQMRERLFEELLPADSAGSRPHDGGVTALRNAGVTPADSAAGTGKSRRGYRQISPSTPADSAAEQLVEPIKREQSSEPTLASSCESSSLLRNSTNERSGEQPLLAELPAAAAAAGEEDRSFGDGDDDASREKDQSSENGQRLNEEAVAEADVVDEDEVKKHFAELDAKNREWLRVNEPAVYARCVA